MITREEIQKHLEETLEDGETIKLADGMEAGFLGIARQFNKAFAVYDRDRCLASLMQQGMNLSEAQEWMGYNVEGAYVGEDTPAFLQTMPTDWDLKQAAALMTATVRCMTAKEIMKDLVRFVEPSNAPNGPEEAECEEALAAAKEYISLFPE